MKICKDCFWWDRYRGNYGYCQEIKEDNNFGDYVGYCFDDNFITREDFGCVLWEKSEKSNENRNKDVC